MFSFKTHEITSLNIETTHKESKETMKARDQQSKYHLENTNSLKGQKSLVKQEDPFIKNNQLRDKLRTAHCKFPLKAEVIQ